METEPIIGTQEAVAEWRCDECGTRVTITRPIRMGVSLSDLAAFNETDLRAVAYSKLHKHEPVKDAD